MNNKLKNTVLTIAVILTVFCVIFGAVYHVGGFVKRNIIGNSWMIKLFGDEDLPIGSFSNEAKLGDIKKIDLDLNVGDVRIVEGDKNYIEIDSNIENLLPKYELKDGILKVYGQSDKKNFTTNNITTDVVITVNSKLDSIEGTLALGDLTIQKVNAEVIDVTLNCGEMEIDSVVAQKIDVLNNLGDVKVNEADFKSLDLTLNLGDVKIVVLGDEEDYNCDVQVDLGSLSVFGEKGKTNYNGGKGEKKISAVVNLGDLTIK